MKGLLNVRDSIRDFLRKYDELISPIFRFIVAYIAFSYINSMFGYSDLYSRGIVILLISIICALVSDKVGVFIAGVVVLMNMLSVSNEVAITFALLAVLIYCLYIRMFPDSAWILILVPILFKLKLAYAAPMIVMMFVGMTGAVPTAFGAIIYYFSKYVKDIDVQLKTYGETDDFTPYKYIIDSFKDNKVLMVQIIVFAVAIIIGTIFYRLSINYSWYIGIGICACVNVLFFVVCGGILSVKISIGSVILGTFVGLIVSLLLQVCKGVVDYSRKETVQFEDDEYYYYVKAVPKYNIDTKKKKSVRRNTTARRAEGSEGGQTANVQNRQRQDSAR